MDYLIDNQGRTIVSKSKRLTVLEQISFSQTHCDSVFIESINSKKIRYTADNNGAWCCGSQNIPSVSSYKRLNAVYSNFVGNMSVGNVGTEIGFSAGPIYISYNNLPPIGDPILNSTLSDYGVSLQLTVSGLKININVPLTSQLLTYNVFPFIGFDENRIYSLAVNFDTAQVFYSVDGDPDILVFSPNGSLDGALDPRTYPASHINGREFYLCAYCQNSGQPGSFDVTVT